jgi:hypothetical protein
MVGRKFIHDTIEWDKPQPVGEPSLFPGSLGRLSGSWGARLRSLGVTDAGLP